MAVVVRPSLSVINDSCHVIAADMDRERITQVTYLGIIRCAVVVLVTLGLVVGNTILALAVNSKHCSRSLQFQTRTLLTAMATNNLATGVLVTMWITYPSMTSCWPYGILFCQIQAVLRGSLGQHSSILWILMAMDRYLYSRWPSLYDQIASSKHCVWVVAMTWVASFTYYTALVLPYDAYDFSLGGLMGCEPVPQTGAFMLISTCLLYFPTTMFVLYVYGSVFHDSRMHTSVKDRRNPNPISCSTGATVRSKCCTSGEDAVTRAMATMSLAFVIDSTPWVVKQIIVACLANEITAWVDFTITWTSLCLGIINPLLCWLLCPVIRSAANERHCKKTAARLHECDTLRTVSCDVENIPGIPEPIYTHCEIHNPHVAAGPQQQQQQALSMEERVWGEILERTLSSSSLHRLQRLYAGPLANGQTTAEHSGRAECSKGNNGNVLWQI